MNRGAFLQPLARVRETRQRGAGNTRFAAAFIQPLARVRETRQCGVGNVRIAVLSFSPSRASGRSESAERETRDSRRFSSAPRAHPRDAKARSGKRTIRGGFLQSLARVRETRQRGVGNVQIAALSLSPLARVRETRQRGVGNARFAAAFFSPSRASARRESAERATRDSRRLSSTPRARPRDAKARSGKRTIRGGFLQSLARVREKRQRGAGKA